MEKNTYAQLEEENRKLKEELESLKEGVLVESLNDMKNELKTIEEKWQKKLQGQKFLTRMFKEQCWKFSVNIDSFHKILEDRMTLSEFMDYEELYSFCEKAQEDFVKLEENVAKSYDDCISGKCGGCSFTFCQVHDHTKCSCGDPAHDD